MGEVAEGGAFPYVEDSTVLDYIAQTKALLPDAHLAWIAIIRQPRDRTDPLAPAQVIRVNFKELHAGEPTAENYFPQPGDVIYVPPKGAEFTPGDIIAAVGSAITGFAVAERGRSSN
jgi:hypothetical protein